MLPREFLPQLKIGNVINPNNKRIKYAIITGVYENGNLKYNGGSEMIQKNIKYISPVIINIDILNRLKHSKLNINFDTIKYNFNIGCIDINLYKNGKYIVRYEFLINSIEHDFRLVIYLHLLQNIVFALTGEELVYT